MEKLFKYILEKAQMTQYEMAKRAKILDDDGNPDRKAISQLVNGKRPTAKDIVPIVRASGLDAEQFWECVVKSYNYMRRKK